MQSSLLLTVAAGLALAGCSGGRVIGIGPGPSETTMGPSTETATTTGAVARTLASPGRSVSPGLGQDILQMQLRGLATTTAPVAASGAGDTTTTPTVPSNGDPVSLRAILAGTQVPEATVLPPTPNAAPKETTISVPQAAPAPVVIAEPARREDEGWSGFVDKPGAPRRGQVIGAASRMAPTPVAEAAGDLSAGPEADPSATTGKRVGQKDNARRSRPDSPVGIDEQKINGLF